jgi:hypothetical protein
MFRPFLFLERSPITKPTTATGRMSQLSQPRRGIKATSAPIKATIPIMAESAFMLYSVTAGKVFYIHLLKDCRISIFAELSYDVAMRIAVIADIHGNIEALETVLDHVEKQSVDQIVVAGDIVIGSPHSLRCWEKVKSLQCSVVRGNHERYLFDLDSPNSPESWKTERYAPFIRRINSFLKKPLQKCKPCPLISVWIIY